MNINKALVDSFIEIRLNKPELDYKPVRLPWYLKSSQYPYGPKLVHRNYLNMQHYLQQTKWAKGIKTPSFLLMG